MKIALVEDEKIHQDYLIDKLKTIGTREGYVLQIHVFQSAEALLFELEDKTFDALLLDIKLDEMNGFSLAKHIRQTDQHIPIAFITGERDYVFEGYTVDACSYILKPIKDQQILDLLIKLEKKLKRDRPSVLVSTGQGHHRVYLEDILYIESDDHVTRVYTREVCLSTKTKMKEWIQDLEGKDFVQAHRSYLVHLRHIDKLDKKTIYIGPVKIPIARGKGGPIFQAYMAYRRQTHS